MYQGQQSGFRFHVQGDRAEQFLEGRMHFKRQTRRVRVRVAYRLERAALVASGPSGIDHQTRGSLL